MRLSPDTLGSLPPEIERPGYDRNAITPGIVHLGIGAFHRAHQAWYTDAVLIRDPAWGIVAASLRSPATRDALEPQGGLYTLAVRSGAGETLRVVGAVREVLVAGESALATQLLLDAMADPRVNIVSLTVTEKGYCHDPASGTLNEDHPDIRHDLENPAAPRTAPGLIAAALARRRAEGFRPFTVLTCDNLPANGTVAKRVIDRFAALRDRDLGAWVAGELACPATMVDRITPATTDADRAAISAALGVEDAWPVVTEPFTQWVIEDHFPTGRPMWELAGAQFAADVAPYELMKLRLLNGAHSSLAYLGYLAGHETVADTMADPVFARYVAGLMEEVTPTVQPHMPAGADLDGYKQALVARFHNPALKHRTWQICMDGSQKLPQRLLGPIADLIAAGRPFPYLALGVAGWMRYVTGVDEAGQPIDVRDPMAAELKRIADAAGRDPDRLARALIAVKPVFGDELPRNPAFTTGVVSALEQVLAGEAGHAVARVTERPAPAR
ncbi:MAG: mannitol dehydrogenase family protein [Alphaproteobacteria bacterium]